MVADYRRKTTRNPALFPYKDLPVSSSAGSKEVTIFLSEMDYISRCILDFKRIETGGQLFGYYTNDGKPVVLYATGPGREANHQVSFFNQDRHYLESVGKALRNLFGLCHIGEWHSHHQFGLACPSQHDTNNMISTIRERALGCFLLCIGNCDDKSSSLNAFLCDDIRCTKATWDVILSESPVRKMADKALASILVHPHTAVACYKNPEIVFKSSARPSYAPGYWLNDKSMGIILKQIIDYIKSHHADAYVRAQLNKMGEVLLSVDLGSCSETILFPNGFPEVAPIITYSSPEIVTKAVPRTGWNAIPGDIYRSFINYYMTC